MTQISVALQKTLRADRREFQLQTRFDSESEVTVLFGPSGAGKTLTMLAIAGLLRPDAGHIAVNGRVLFDSAARIDVAARARKIGLVFQDYALFPHLNVLQNVAFAQNHGWHNSDVIDAPTREWLRLTDLENSLHAFPADLSGGQRQRVALVRALASHPQLLLLDEPFSALDAPLRTRLRDELLEIRKRARIPMIVITHNEADIEALGGRVVHMDHGRVVD